MVFCLRSFLALILFFPDRGSFNKNDVNRLMSNVQFVLMKDWKLQGILFSNCVWLKKEQELGMNEGRKS